MSTNKIYKILFVLLVPPVLLSTLTFNSGKHFLVFPIVFVPYVIFSLVTHYSFNKLNLQKYWHYACAGVTPGLLVFIIFCFLKDFSQDTANVTTRIIFLFNITVIVFGLTYSTFFWAWIVNQKHTYRAIASLLLITISVFAMAPLMGFVND